MDQRGGFVFFEVAAEHFVERAAFLFGEAVEVAGDAFCPCWAREEAVDANGSAFGEFCEST